MPDEKIVLESLKRPSTTAAATLPEPESEPAEPHVRFTVDLSDSDHHYLKLLSAESRLSMSDLMRGAVKLMREQSDLAAMVRQRARRL